MLDKKQVTAWQVTSKALWSLYTARASGWHLLVTPQNPTAGCVDISSRKPLLEIH